EGVDIEASSEHEYNIGWTQADEWVEYSIQVMSAGVYRADLRFAAASDKSYFHLEIDRANLTGTVEIPVTGGWQTWTTVTLPYLYLSEGRKMLRFHAESAGFNINYLNFTLLEATQLPQIKLTAPQDDDRFQLGESIALSADASDPDGYIRQVEFFANSKKIGQAVSIPYTISWIPDKIDQYELYARAVDNVGAFALSDTLTIGIKFPSFDDGPFFSAEHGFYTTPFDLQIDGGTSGTVIQYTLDGSDPLNSQNALRAISPAQIRVDPASSTNRGNTPAFVVRAVTMAGAVQKSRVRTQTYIFTGRVRAQRRPANWPESGINGQNLRYDISTEVVNDAQYKTLIEPALKDIPTLSMATDMANLFDPLIGIYVNALQDGIDWERPASLELINADGTQGFQVDAGVRIRGGWSRNAYFPKHAFRWFFREQYGYAKLKYPLFGDEGGEEFDKMDLRCSQNYSWHSEGSPLNTENRDVFSRDLQREMGQPYTRSRYYHLYINGLYWGLYETQERSEAAYAATYLGGDPEDYDVVKVDAGPGRPYNIEATDGNLDGWRQVWDACQRGFTSDQEYFKLEGRAVDGSPDLLGQPLVDIDNLIDYMLVILHTG
ncbi:MAG: carbohydrate-binding protein, partial [Calditrichaeota bacterium]